MEVAYLPSLPLESWAATKDTLHLWTQVVGKIKLAYVPPRNHWWHVTLHLDVHGLTTGRIPVDETTRFEIRFDFVEHFVSITTNAGAEERLDLHDGTSVAAFDREVHAMLERLGVDVAIVETPYGVPMTTDLTEDEEHASYDCDAVTRFWRILDWSDTVLKNSVVGSAGRPVPSSSTGTASIWRSHASTVCEHRLDPMPTRSPKRRIHTR